MPKIRQEDLLVPELLEDVIRVVISCLPRRLEDVDVLDVLEKLCSNYNKTTSNNSLEDK